MKNYIKKIIRVIYEKLPFSKKIKTDIKNCIYKKFRFILKNTDMYKVWLSQYEVNKEYMANEEIKSNDEVNSKKNIYKEIVMNMYKNSSSHSIDFVKYEPEIETNIIEEDIKLIAFYLPQFHTFKENEEWWGRGFTEWTNVTKAVPQYLGHHQPQLPIDVGFYDTRVIDTQKRQIELARQYGIFGFCFHYYWFSGKRLMEKPLDIFLDNPNELNFPFCLCWANENWTRRWDGMEHDVLIAQEHLPQDNLKFIEDISKYIKDKRYIKIENKPVIIVYRPSILDNAKETFKIWREYCRNNDIGEIYLIGAKSFGFEGQIELGMDACVEFPPHTTICPDVTDNFEILNPDFCGNIYDINYFVKNKYHLYESESKTFKTVFPSWDNTARKPKNPSIFHGSNPALYGEWLRDCMKYTKEKMNKEERFVFVNAWNEWAEGAHLEPDRKYGYAYLKETRNAILEIRDGKKKIIYVSHDALPYGAQMLSLSIIKSLNEDFGYEVYCILKEDGDLIPDFEKYCKDLICIKTDLNSDISRITDWVKLTGATKAICNTVVVGDILEKLSDCKIDCISLIHEMKNVIHQYKCEENLRKIIKYAKKIVFASKYVKESVDLVFKTPIEKTVILPQGMYKLNTYLNEKSKIKHQVYSEYKIDKANDLVIGVGSGDYRKGVDLFVSCALEVCARNQNISFLWVGKMDPDMDIHLNKMLEFSEYKNRILFAGYTEDAMKYYAAADIFLLTSREDPFPTVVMEAMYAKLPVIAFEGGGGYVENISPSTGRLVGFEDFAEMADVVLEYIENPKYRISLGQNAHEVVLGKFDFIKYIYQILGLLGENYKKISVVIPNYNYENYLSKRIESIINQTYPIFELIILDDCSEDKSIEVINHYKKKYPLKIKVFRNHENSGNVFNQWERGLKQCSGDYIWIAEADDLSEYNFVESLVRKLEDDSDVIMAYSQSKMIDKDGVITQNNYLSYTNYVDEKIWIEDYISDGIDEICKRLSIKNTIPNVSGVLFKNGDFANSINEAKKFQVAGDWIFYIEILKNNKKIAFCSESLNLHRRHDGSITIGTKAKVHFDEIAKIQNYIIRNFEVSEEIKSKIDEYRNELKLYFGLK